MSVGATALLVLEDGRTFTGDAYGAPGDAFGEAVFATGMTGYQETLTDPSYHRQVVVQTAPHIGNTGVNDEDPESRRIWVAGYVVRDPARRASSWRAARSLDDELTRSRRSSASAASIPARSPGTCASAARCAAGSRPSTTAETLLDKVLASPPMTGADLSAEVTTDRAVHRRRDRRRIGSPSPPSTTASRR